MKSSIDSQKLKEAEEAAKKLKEINIKKEFDNSFGSVFDRTINRITEVETILKQNDLKKK